MKKETNLYVHITKKENDVIKKILEKENKSETSFLIENAIVIDNFIKNINKLIEEDEDTLYELLCDIKKVKEFFNRLLLDYRNRNITNEEIREYDYMEYVSIFKKINERISILKLKK